MEKEPAQKPEEYDFNEGDIYIESHNGKTHIRIYFDAEIDMKTIRVNMYDDKTFSISYTDKEGLERQSPEQRLPRAVDWDTIKKDKLEDGIEFILDEKRE